MSARRDRGCRSLLVVLTLLFVLPAAIGHVGAACPEGTSVPIRSGTGESGVPVVFSFEGLGVYGSFFILGAGDGHNSGFLPASAWLVPLGDLDGDGRQEFRIEAPGEGPGGWGDARTAGCPAFLSPPHPPLVIVLEQAQEDYDHDGAFDVFEDMNRNGQIDIGEDRDQDGRLTPPLTRTRFGYVPGCEGGTREDQDCDGHLDRFYEDLNHDGFLSPGEDRDGDHRLDLINEDRNGNGALDAGEDLNGNGVLDIGLYIEDRNGDLILNDRPHPQPDDQIYEYLPGGDRRLAPWRYS